MCVMDFDITSIAGFDVRLTVCVMDFDITSITGLD